jgi:predicted Zn-dependent peptidase
MCSAIIETTKRTDGLVISSDHVNTVETVSINFTVKTGSRNEQGEIGGLSHFLEHMAFKGTDTRSARDIAEEFDMIGGIFNAYTSRERTVYYAKVLKESLPEAIDILTDILQNSTFAEEEIEKEKSVILQEIAQTLDSPDDLIFDDFQRLAYPEQAIGRSILGTPEFVKSVTKAQLEQYMQERYSFNNIFVSAAGNIHHDELVKLIDDKFTKMPEELKQFEEKSNYLGGDKRIQKDLEQIHVVMGFDGVSYLDDKYYHQQILSLIAGGGMSSRLFQEVRENRGLSYHISAFSNSYRDTGMFSIYAGTDEKNLNELIEVTAGEMHKIIQNSITEEELNRAKAQVKAALLISQENMTSRAEKLSANLAIYDRYIHTEEIIQKVEAITINDIQDHCKTIFSSGKQPTIASIGKIDNMKEYEDICKLFAA